MIAFMRAYFFSSNALATSSSMSFSETSSFLLSSFPGCGVVGFSVGFLGSIFFRAVEFLPSAVSFFLWARVVVLLALFTCFSSFYSLLRSACYAYLSISSCIGSLKASLVIFYSSFNSSCSLIFFSSRTCCL